MNPTTFQALAEPNRFHIVELLRHKPMPVGELVETLCIRQPQVSKHLKVLADAGIVEVHPQANQRIYELSPKRFQEIDAWLQKYRAMWESRFDALEKVLEKEKKKLRKKKGLGR
jgi:DNA-binding transcriptional ArsR family regulator